MDLYKNVDGVQTLMTPEEAAEYWRLQDVVKADQLILRTQGARNERNRLLAESDGVIVRAQEAGTPVPQAWVTYRQALRDVPQQAGFPDNIQWPTKPV